MRDRDHLCEISNPIKRKHEINLKGSWPYKDIKPCGWGVQGPAYMSDVKMCKSKIITFFDMCLCTRECLLGLGFFSCNCLHQLCIKYVAFTADMAVD